MTRSRDHQHARSLEDQPARSGYLAELAPLQEHLPESLSLQVAVREARAAVDAKDSAAPVRALSLATAARSREMLAVEGDALVVAALGLRDSKEPARALALLREAADDRHGRLDPRASAEICRVVGIMLRRTGDVAGAIATYEDAVRFAGDSAAVSARILISLGYLRLVQGHLADARASFVRAREVMDRVHLRRDRARLEANFAHLALVLGDLDGAMEHLTQALSLHDQGVDRDIVVDTLCLRAQAALDLDRLDVAEEVLSRAKASNEEAPTPYDDAHVSWLVGRLALAKGEPDRALAIIEQALESAKSHRLVGFATVLAADRARAREMLGQHSEARAGAVEALDLLGEPGGADFAAEALESLAAVPGARDVFAPTAMTWLGQRFERAGAAEKDLLARHPRLQRITRALR
jgi:tetratricopeptide (TPR) repeat protein